MTDIELKPCPFCGSRQLTHTNHGLPSKRAWITCEDCGATGPFVEGVELAAAAWNKRAESGWWFASYFVPGVPSYDELQAENRELKNIITAQNLQIAKSSAENARLRDNLIQCRGENAELYDYGADMRIAIRKARKVLKGLSDHIAPDGEMYAEVTEARQILKDALKEGK